MIIFLYSVTLTGFVGDNMEVKSFAGNWRVSGPGCWSKIAGRKVF